MNQHDIDQWETHVNSKRKPVRQEETTAEAFLVSAVAAIFFFLSLAFTVSLVMGVYGVIHVSTMLYGMMPCVGLTILLFYIMTRPDKPAK